MIFPFLNATQIFPFLSAKDKSTSTKSTKLFPSILKDVVKPYSDNSPNTCPSISDK